MTGRLWRKGVEAEWEKLHLEEEKGEEDYYSQVPAAPFREEMHKRKGKLRTGVEGKNMPHAWKKKTRGRGLQCVRIVALLFQH